MPANLLKERLTKFARRFVIYGVKFLQSKKIPKLEVKCVHDSKFYK